MVKKDLSISLNKDHINTVVDDLGNTAVVTNYNVSVRVNRLNDEESVETHYQNQILSQRAVLSLGLKILIKNGGW